VFTMGRPPVANLNALRFGDPSCPAPKHVVDGVVRGIGGYGNCVGVPDGGRGDQISTPPTRHPLVNANDRGHCPSGQDLLSAAAGVGNPVVYVGFQPAATAIHGATSGQAPNSARICRHRPRDCPRRRRR